jgi:hypothetical protein
MSDAKKAQEGEEIDRIMKEIEDLEKKMESPTELDKNAEGQSALQEVEKEMTSVAEAVASAETESEATPETPEPFLEEEVSNVVELRRNAAVQESDSLVETDAVPPQSDAPLFQGSTEASGSLGLKVGGCQEITLEFSRAGLAVSLTCTDEELKIRTDQGAEFRLPFKKAA